MSAQDSPQGVPRELIEAKKADLVQEKASNLRSLATFSKMLTLCTG